MIIVRSLLCIALALAVAGCGKRGNLEAPGAASAELAPPTGPATAEVTKRGRPEKPHEPFILDGLL